VKAPRSCPKSSLSTRSRGIAPQLTTTNGPSQRSELACRACATTSFPVPDSPVIRTVASVGAMRWTVATTRSIAGEAWISSSDLVCSRSRSRSERFSRMRRCRSRACATASFSSSRLYGLVR